MIRTLPSFSFFPRWTDPRAETLPFMENDFFPIVIIIGYLFFIFIFGPLYMRGRPAFQVIPLIKAYNLVQIVLNFIGVCCATYYFPQTNFTCTEINNSTNFEGLFQLYSHYLYCLLKIFDLLDTVFFVLRKKWGQISFLHLYHHVGMVLGSWFTCKYYPGGQLYYLGGVNSFIHTLMYYYYYKTVTDPAFKNNMWWKKHLTQLQILQHCIILLATIIPLFNTSCNYSKILLVGYLPYGIPMIYLFVDFYIKTYMKKAKV